MTMEELILAYDFNDINPNLVVSHGLTIEWGRVEFQLVWTDFLYKVRCWMTMF